MLFCHFFHMYVQEIYIISIISMQSMMSANYPVIYSRSYIFLHTDHNQKYGSLAIA